MMKKRVIIIALVVVALIAVGGWLHHRALAAERSHANLTLVTSYHEVEGRIRIVQSSHLPLSVHDAMQKLALLPALKPQKTPQTTIEAIVKNLISLKNQLYVSSYSKIYAVYFSSANSPIGNVLGESYEAPDWIVVCTGLDVPRTTWHGDAHSKNPALYSRVLHNLTWYFGIPSYPNAWSIWLYSAETVQMLENTSGTTPQSAWPAYVLSTL